jgi:hypothetical protein
MGEQWLGSKEKVIVKLEDMKNHGCLGWKEGRNKGWGLVEHLKRILSSIVFIQTVMAQTQN